MFDQPSLTLTRRLKAPAAKVFAAWTDPQLITRWWHPVASNDRVEAEIDLRIGGRFRVRVHTAGGEQHDVGGEYREIVPHSRLVFTWAWHSTPERESLVTVALEDITDGTLLTLSHQRFFDEAARDRHQVGWCVALDSLVRLIQ